MKNKNEAPYYFKKNNKNTYIFSAIFSVSSVIKRDLSFLIDEFQLLFHEKLPIFYANIRV
jgi:hypothetical protein